MKPLWVLLLGLLSLSGRAMPAHAARAVPVPDAALLRYDSLGDRLGARLRVRELSQQPLDARAWKWLERQVLAHPEWGEDLLMIALDRSAKDKDWFIQSPAQAELDAADNDLLNKRFTEAAGHYRKALESDQIQDVGSTGVAHIRLALARALYAAKKFDEAYVEARKIPAKFSRFRHVLFLRMWSAFRAGRVEAALGEIAAQRSSYFSQYAEPESYLLLVYLLKRLCREEEAGAVIAQVESFLADLKSGSYQMKDWARTDVGAYAFLRLLESTDPAGLAQKARADRDEERAWIRRLLMTSFQKKQKQWLEELPRVLAYSRLATTPGMGAGLRPIEKITSRSRLLSQGYEIWPVEDGEQWLDELGYQRYLGDSQCLKK